VWLTLLSALALGVYDNYLLQNLALDSPRVHAWFSLYLLVVLLPIVLLGVALVSFGRR